jgi:creatinine amidohydrolase
MSVGFFRVLLASALAALLLALQPSISRAAQPDAGEALESLTSPELAARIAGGATTILVPIGGTEQNGPYMTLGKHNARVVELATRIARKLGNALVAPVVAYVPEGAINPPTAHMRFPGTITVPDAVFEAMLESIARSFRLHGFHDIVLLGDHGGYQASLARVAARLDKEWAAGPVRVHAMPEYYRASASAFDKVLAQRGFSTAEIGTHAGLADTALTMAAAPASVRLALLQQAKHPSTDRGVYGDPARATAALGEAGVDAIVAATVDAIMTATMRPTRR